MSLPAIPQAPPDPDAPLIRVSVNFVQADASVTGKSNGFTGVADKPIRPPANESPPRQPVRALDAPFQSSAISVKLTGLFAVDSPQSPYRHCLLHVGLETVKFTTGADGVSPHNTFKPAPIAIEPGKPKNVG